MTPAQEWWYMHELKKKQTRLELDADRVERLMNRPHVDRNERNRLKLELDTVRIRLAKVKRGLLF